MKKIKSNLRNNQKINRKMKITKIPVRQRKKIVNLKKEPKRKISQIRHQKQQQKRNH
jgi:hypothetical protein